MRIIEFVGMPRAGKTTQANCLVSHCATKGLRAVTLSDRERIKVMHTTSADAPMFDVLLGAFAVEMYYACLKADPPVDILILDRGWNDILVWSHLMYFLNKTSPEENRAIQTLFWPYTRRVEKTVYFSLPTQDILDRHAKTEHMACDDAALRPDILDRLSRSYEKQWPLLHNICTIDGLERQEVTTANLIEMLKL